MDELIQHLQTISYLTPDASIDLASSLKYFFALKKEFLLQPGYICDRIHFISTGVVREFHYKTNEKTISSWFGFENDIAVSLKSFVEKSPSYIGFEALSNTEGFYLTREALYNLYDEHHCIERLGRILTEQNFIKNETYQLEFSNTFSTEKYDMLLIKYPKIFQKVPLRYIASYMGVSVETLSRIRRKMT